MHDFDGKYLKSLNRISEEIVAAAWKMLCWFSFEKCKKCTFRKYENRLPYRNMESFNMYNRALCEKPLYMIMKDQNSKYHDQKYPQSSFYLQQELERVENSAHLRFWKYDLRKGRFSISGLIISIISQNTYQIQSDKASNYVYKLILKSPFFGYPQVLCHFSALRYTEECRIWVTGKGRKRIKLKARTE